MIGWGPHRSPCDCGAGSGNKQSTSTKNHAEQYKLTKAIILISRITDKASNCKTCNKQKNGACFIPSLLIAKAPLAEMCSSAPS